jgi:hypothetical protein
MGAFMAELREKREEAKVSTSPATASGSAEHFTIVRRVTAIGR